MSRCDGLELIAGCTPLADPAAKSSVVSVLPGSVMADLLMWTQFQESSGAVIVAREGAQSDFAVAGKNRRAAVRASGGGYCRCEEPGRVDLSERVG